MVGDGPAAHGGGINLETETAVDFGGGAAIRRGRFGGEQFAQERLDASGPVRRVIAARSARRPERCRRVGGGVEIIGVELVEAGAAEAEFYDGDGDEGDKEHGGNAQPHDLPEPAAGFVAPALAGKAKVEAKPEE